MTNGTTGVGFKAQNRVGAWVASSIAKLAKLPVGAHQPMPVAATTLGLVQGNFGAPGGWMLVKHFVKKFLLRQVPADRPGGAS